MRILIRLFIIIISFSISFCKTSRPDKQIAGEAYFVDNKAGKDINPGTVRRPLKTIAEVNRRLQERPASVWFAGGQVFDGTLFLKGICGTDSFNINIGSFGEGTAVINGGESEAIRVEECRFFHIENLNMTGNGRKYGNTANGLSLIRCKNFRIEGVTARGFQKSGVNLFDCMNGEISRVVAHDNGFCGIHLMGSDQKLSGHILIKDCRAENNPGDPTRLDNHSGNGILVGVSDSVVIDRCSATNNGWDMPRQGNGPVGIWAWMSNNVTIQYCISYRNRTSPGGKDGGGFDFDGGVTNSLIQYCLSYENEGAGYGLFQYPGAAAWSGNVIRYCVSINDAHTTEGAGSFFIWNGSNDSSQLTDCYLHNNVAYNTKAPLISFEDASDHGDFLFSNNIFLGSGDVISGVNEGTKFLGNVWWSSDSGIRFGGYDSLEKWAKATGQETENGRLAGMHLDPLLQGPFATDITDPYRLNELSGYLLKTDSPVKDKGRRINPFNGFNPPLVDFFGNSFSKGAAPAPGIHELK